MIYGWADAHPENINEFVERFGAKELPLHSNYRCPPHIVRAANQVIALNERRRDVFMESRVEIRGGDVIVLAAQNMSEGEIVAREIERALADGIQQGEIAVLAPHHFKFDDVVASLGSHGIRYVHTRRGRFSSVPLVYLLSLGLRCVAGGTIVPDDIHAVSGTKTLALSVAAIRAAAEEASAGSPRGLINRLVASG